MDIMRNISIRSIDWNKEKFNPKKSKYNKKICQRFKANKWEISLYCSNLGFSMIYRPISFISLGKLHGLLTGNQPFVALSPFFQIENFNLG